MRARVRFSKLGKVRYTSHRDVARMWERAFRRTGLQLAYSAGFTPRPKVSFGLALPTGHESVAEYLDLELAEGVGLDADLAERLSAAMPVGVDVAAVAEVDRTAPSLQDDVTSCDWRFAATSGTGEAVGDDELAERVATLLGASSAPVARFRKGDSVIEDVRPGILDLRVGAADADAGHRWLEAELATKPRTLRPADVLAAMGGGLVERSVRRQHQWIVRHGARWEPLDAPIAATGAPHAEVRA